MRTSNEIADITQYRLKRKRVGSAKWILVLVLLLVCLFAGYFFARSDFFTVTEITVQGNTHADKDQLIHLSGYTVGGSLFSVTPADAEQWLLINPYVLSAQVRRIWPNRVNLQITERQPVALMCSDLAYIEIDDSGKVLQRYSVLKTLELPVVSGVDLSESGIVPGGYISGTGITEALELIRSMPEDATDVGEINVANPQDIRLFTKDGIQIRVGDCHDFAEKHLLYTTILADFRENSDRVIDYIDVSITTKWAIQYK